MVLQLQMKGENVKVAIIWQKQSTDSGNQLVVTV